MRALEQLQCVILSGGYILELSGDFSTEYSGKEILVFKVCVQATPPILVQNDIMYCNLKIEC